MGSILENFHAYQNGLNWEAHWIYVENDRDEVENGMTKSKLGGKSWK
jgi:hypothetical protein